MQCVYTIALRAYSVQGDDVYRLEAFDFGRRMAVEREYRAAADAPPSNVVFDETGKLLIYASAFGIKVTSQIGLYKIFFHV